MLSSSRQLMCSARAGIRRLVTIGDESAYQNLKDANKKKIYYFTASWCPPCRKIAPVYEALSKAHSGVTFSKIDIDVVPSAAEENGISSVPTFQFWNGNAKLAQFAGANEESLKSNILKLEKA